MSSSESEPDTNDWATQCESESESEAEKSNSVNKVGKKTPTTDGVEKRKSPSATPSCHSKKARSASYERRRSSSKADNGKSRRKSTPSRNRRHHSRDYSDRKRNHSSRARDNTPKKRDGTSKRRDDTSKTRDDTPKTRDNTPRRRDNTPKRRDKTPKRRDNSPKKRGNSPKRDNNVRKDHHSKHEEASGSKYQRPKSADKKDCKKKIPPNEHNPATEVYYLDQIDSDKENHILVTDYKVAQCLKDFANKITIIDMPDDTMENMTEKAKDLIVNRDQTKPTFLTLAIFERNFNEIGVIGVQNVAKEISNCIKGPRDENKPDPSTQIKVTLTTIGYKPALEHKWVDIEQVNHFLKLETLSMGSLPFNMHRWTMRPARQDPGPNYISNLKEVKGALHVEYQDRIGLGLTLTNQGVKKYIEGAIRHHASFGQPIGEVVQVERRPRELANTRGYKLTPPSPATDWLLHHIAFMEGQVIYEEQQRQNRLHIMLQNQANANHEEHSIAVQVVEDEALAEPEEGEIIEAPQLGEGNLLVNPVNHTPPRAVVQQDIDSADSDEEANPKPDTRDPYVQLMERMILERDNQIHYLENRWDEQGENLADIEQEILKAESVNKDLTKKVNTYEKQYQRDQQKIDDLKAQLRDHQKEKDLQDKRIQKIEDNMSEEAKYLRERIDDLKQDNEVLEKNLAVSTDLVATIKKQNALLNKQNKQK